MYAIVKTSGKQYLVGKNDKILVGKIDAKPGTNLVLDQVLLCGDGNAVKLGAATTSPARVKAKVLRHTRGDKVMVFKFKRRKNYRRSLGHRQDLTLLHITDIVMDGKPSKPAQASAGKPKAAKASIGKKPATAGKAKPTAGKKSASKAKS